MAEPLSFDQYKVAKEDDKSVEVIGPSGNPLLIAKSGLGKQALERVASLPRVEPVAPEVENPGVLYGVGKALRGGADYVSGIGKNVVEDIQGVKSRLGEGVSSVAAGFTGAPPKLKGTLASNEPVGVPGLETPAPDIDTTDTIGVNAPQAAPVVDPLATPAAPKVDGVTTSLDQLTEAKVANEQAKRDALDAETAGLQKIAEQYEADRAKFQTDIDDMQKQIAEGQVSPNRLWDQAGTGSQIGAAIAIALGGIGAGLSGGKNQALDVIENAIARDVAAQEKNLGRKESLLQTMLTRYKDLDTAKAQAANAMRQNTLSQIARAETSVNSKEAKFQGETLKAALLAKQKEATDAAAQKAALLRVGTPGAAPINPEILIGMGGAAKEVGERLIRLPDGRQVLITRKEDVGPLTDEVATISPIRGLLKELDTLSKNPNAMTSPVLADKAQAIRAKLVPLLKENQNVKKLMEGATGKDGEKFSLLDSVEDPTAFKNLLGDAKLNASLVKYLDDKLDAKLTAKASNYAPAFTPKTATPFVAAR
jgi:hypothetical protein